MQKKENFILILIAVVTTVMLFSLNNILKKNDAARLLYKVYLNGDNIGVIDNKNIMEFS